MRDDENEGGIELTPEEIPESLRGLTPEQLEIARRYASLNRHGKRAAASLARKRAKADQRKAASLAARKGSRS